MNTATMASTGLDKASRLIKRQSQLQSDRSNFETLWRQVAERVSPDQNIFQRTIVTQGEQRSEYVFDTTATTAAKKLAGYLESGLAPKGQKWHMLRAQHDPLNDDREVVAYLEKLNQLLFDMRSSPRANFANQLHMAILSMVYFGTGILFMDELVGDGGGPRYKSIHLQEAFISEDHSGNVDSVFRKFRLTARAAMQKWGDKNSEKVKASVENAPDTYFEFIHAVYPNDEIQEGRKDYKGMRYASCYVSVEGRELLSEGGYRTFPYAVCRFGVVPGEVYARSPIMEMLPDIKTLNEMVKTRLRGGQLAVSPPLLLPTDGILGNFQMRSNALNYGGVDEQGRPLVRPLEVGGNFQLALDFETRVRASIQEGLFIDLFQLPTDSPNMTATEIIQRAQQKGELLGPIIDRFQSELLNPLIERGVDILEAMGMLPEPPEAMIEGGDMINVEFQSPLALAAMSGDVQKLIQAFQLLAPFEQVAPGTIAQTFNIQETAKFITEKSGVPASVLYSTEQQAQMKQEAAQQQQAAQILQAAPVAAGAVKDLAQAQSLSQSVPNQILPQILGGEG
jgi:Bacteriophage head to tail connecting protein